jgi:LPS sulfotransferase NodH
VARSPTAFVVLTSPRTGSSWLVDTLRGHPRVETYRELFIPGGTERDAERYGSHGIPSFDTYVHGRRPPRTKLGFMTRRIAYVNRLYEARPDVDAVGFKLTYRQAALNPGLLPYLSLRRVRVVHLMRMNLLSAIVSLDTANARDIFHAREGDALPAVRVRFEPAALLKRLDQHDFSVMRARGRILSLRLPYLEAFYEELVGRRRDEKLAEIFEFLDVDPDGAVESSLRRLNDVPLAELIENHDEVHDALAGTRFEWML